MKPTITKFILVGAFAAAAASAPAEQRPQQTAAAEVKYEQPEEFTDFQQTYAPGRGADEGYMQELKKHIQERATERLQPGQNLQVTITDVDMAGEFEPERGARFSDVRIVKDIYPPRIELRFRLMDSSGETIAEGERKLSDLAFSSRLQPMMRDDPLRYEKQLINDFLRDITRQSNRRSSE